jgi:hypothetical protein
MTRFVFCTFDKYYQVKENEMLRLKQYVVVEVLREKEQL